jgi:hypothetical protein
MVPKSCNFFSNSILAAVSEVTLVVLASLALAADTDDSGFEPGAVLGSTVDVTASLVSSVALPVVALLQAEKESIEHKASALEALERLKRVFMSKFDFVMK